jgi:hypothetical protein
MNISGYDRTTSRVPPRMVSRKLLLPPHTGTNIATLNTMAMVCSHHGSGLNKKWCAPMIG